VGKSGERGESRRGVGIGVQWGGQKQFEREGRWGPWDRWLTWGVGREKRSSQPNKSQQEMRGKTISPTPRPLPEKGKPGRGVKNVVKHCPNTYYNGRFGDKKRGVEFWITHPSGSKNQTEDDHK